MFGSLNVTTVEVQGVAAAIDKHKKGESKGVKAYFKMDESGILNLEKVCLCVLVGIYYISLRDVGS